MDYQRAAQIFATARDPGAGKPLGNNTRLHRREECYAVRLHWTDVVTYHPDGSVTLNSGGWRTTTTKARINEYAPGGYRVYSDRGEWYVYSRGEKQAPFADGVTIRPDGSITGAGELSDLAAGRAQKRRIANYARAYTEELFAGRMPAPSGADCWYCGLRDAEGTPMGAGNPDHLLAHMDEPYYVPSLVWNAFRSSGGSTLARQVAADLQLGGRPAPAWAEFAQEHIRKAIAKYLTRELATV